jgi:hypothetical protein
MSSDIDGRRAGSEAARRKRGGEAVEGEVGWKSSIFSRGNMLNFEKLAAFSIVCSDFRSLSDFCLLSLSRSLRRRSARVLSASFASRGGSSWSRRMWAWYGRGRRSIVEVEVSDLRRSSGRVGEVAARWCSSSRWSIRWCASSTAAVVWWCAAAWWGRAAWSEVRVRSSVRVDLGGVHQVMWGRLADGEWCTLTSASGRPRGVG